MVEEHDPDGGEPVDPLLRARWHEAEQRLYPLAVSDPGRYERAVRLVRAVVDHLSATGTTLAAGWEDRDALVSSVAERAGLALDLPAEVVAGAALTLRSGELDAERARRAHTAAVAAARAEGSDWARLGERGDLEAGLMSPYHAVDLHLGSGLALIQDVETDASTGAAAYVTSVVRLDPDTGVLVDFDPGVADTTTTADPASHRENVQRTKALIERAAQVAAPDPHAPAP